MCGFRSSSTTVKQKIICHCLESIQFGLKGFLIDTIPGQKQGMYRDFPEICITTPTEAIGWIKRIDVDAGTYPRGGLDGLVDFSGKMIFDEIRHGLGLPPKEDDRPVQ